MSTHFIVVSSPEGIHFAGPVTEPDEDSITQPMYEAPVEVPAGDAHYAFDWATDEAIEWWMDQCGMSAQVWHIVDGIVTEYAHVTTDQRQEYHCYWCGYTIVGARVRNDGAPDWEHVSPDAGWSVHTAKP